MHFRGDDYNEDFFKKVDEDIDAQLSPEFSAANQAAIQQIEDSKKTEEKDPETQMINYTGKDGKTERISLAEFSRRVALASQVKNPSPGKDNMPYTDLGNTTGTLYRKFCDHPPQKVIDGKTWEVWAGARWDCLKHARRFPFVMNLTSMSITPEHHIPIPELAKWEGGKTAVKEIMLDWVDGEAIEFPIEFWVELRKYLIRNKAKLLIFCLGGHGRTGTAVCAILIACGWTSQGAIDWLRANYCKEVVETWVQECYLDDLEKQYQTRIASGKKGKKDAD